MKYKLRKPWTTKSDAEPRFTFTNIGAFLWINDKRYALDSVMEEMRLGHQGQVTLTFHHHPEYLDKSFKGTWRDGNG